MNRLFIFIFIVSLHVQAQKEVNYPEVVYGKENIRAAWVSHPDIKGGEDVAVLFRNTFNVDDLHGIFIHL